jgi:alpha-L-arabinofuranosidase
VKSLTVGKVKKSRFVKPQPIVSVVKAKLPAKVQTGVSVKKSKSEKVKAKASVTVQKAKSKIEETIKNKVLTPQLSDTKKTNLQKSKAILPGRKVKSIEKKIKPKNVQPAGKVSKRIDVKRIENKIEPTKLPAARKAVKKKTKPISSAVFRGKKNRYDFQVFPIDAEFEDVSAIYIISKRKIDKRKRAHHALVCIGQTDSISGEMKKHKKGKCVKQHQANAISILPETNEKTRLKIETDLKAAHTIPCIHA